MYEGFLCLKSSVVKAMSFKMLQPASYSQLSMVCVQVCMIRPERWWTMLAKNEVRRNSDGGSYRYWRANRSSYVGI